MYIYDSETESFQYVDQTYPTYTNYYTYNEETNGYYPYFPEPTVYFSTSTPIYVEDSGVYYYVDEPTPDYSQYYALNEVTHSYEPLSGTYTNVDLFTYDTFSEQYVPYVSTGSYDAPDAYFYDEATSNYFTYSPEPKRTFFSAPPSLYIYDQETQTVTHISEPSSEYDHYYYYD